jgi:ABC-type multidrug transport system ATPase subunit
MAAIDTVIETFGLTKRYRGDVLAVDHLDLIVRRGEVYGFLGPNGAGKTTTLRMLVGLIRPSSGSAQVLGGEPGAPERLAQIGCLVENPAFYPYLSGRDNLRLIAHYCRVPRDSVDRVLNEVNLFSRADDRYSTYSLGMKQRLGVGAALLKDPELLILDEPTNGLDPEGMVEMRELINWLSQSQRTVLLSSHMLNEVEHICHRVGVIQHGRLIAEGRLSDLRGGASLLVRAVPQERAQRLLVDLLGAEAVQARDGALVLTVDPGRAGEVSTRLGQAGVVVSELRTRERSLEEVFLQLTRSSSPAEQESVWETVP